VQVFEDNEQRLLLALPQQEPPERVQGRRAALRRVDPRPVGLVHRHVQERQGGRQDGPERLVKPQYFADDFVAHALRVIVGVDAAVVFEQVDNREIRSGLAIRDGATLQHHPPLRPR
jgi:hypothetical protein